MYSVSTSADGSVYITGETSGNLDGQINKGYDDFFLSKYTSDGSKVWTQTIGTFFGEYGYSVSTAADGSVYVAGETGGNFDGQINNGELDAFLIKYNSDGFKEWTQLLGTSSNDWANSVSTAEDGSIYIAGYTDGNLDGEHDSNSHDAFLSKYNRDGALEWTKQIGQRSYHQEGNSVSAVSDGSVYIAGRTQTDLDGQTHSGGWSDAFLSKYNSDGSREWTKMLGVVVPNTKRLYRISRAADDGSVYIVGMTEGDLDGQINNGQRDVFLSKYSRDGHKAWTKVLGTSSDEWGYSVSADDVGSIYIAGYTEGNLDGQTNSGGGDAFLSKYSKDQSASAEELSSN